MAEINSKITPCLWFDGNGEEAAHFYTSVFKNSRIVEVTRYPSGSHGTEGAVMTVTFDLDGHRFVALNGGPEFTFNEAVSFQVACESQDEVDYFWSRLVEGGEEGPCGWLKDRFGLSWQIIPSGVMDLLTDPDPERAMRATQAMYGMKKIDMAAMRRAADEA
jgi:predicted 3-demethylubiquinone-9 3-methyltransferase (glyoxalase superfamily)